MAEVDRHLSRYKREQTVLSILQNLHQTKDKGLKELFWTELNYSQENKPLSLRQWPDSARQPLADDPTLFATGGEDGAFHIIYTRLAGDALPRGAERPIVNQLLREHPYALFAFSNKNQSAWHFLNVKLALRSPNHGEHRDETGYNEAVEKRRLLRRITVRRGEGLRTAAERLALLDLQAISPDLFGLSPLLIQQHHDEAFDVEKVTKDFYEEIANWYFWARECPGVFFPKDVETEEGRALFLIRLLTRLIFCWFLKEKRNPQAGDGLIPDTLFDPHRIKDLLKDQSPEGCSYYTAILQNLFFATLSTEMDPSAGGASRPGEPQSRRWIEEGDGERSDDHMIHTVWRHASQLRDPVALEKLLRNIPFLNGGLFECLDDRVQKGNSPYTMEVRIDGFAADPKKQPKLPNFLFYGSPQEVNLSEAYGDSSRRREVVRPLLDILSRYKFTIEESTPFDQEVALDPELLGHVFENLLAAYNPETGTVARKATGSFYTPRVVVDWMVDQALLIYLKEKLTTEDTESAEKKLRRLLSWEEEEGHDFQPAEVEKLIDAIDGLKAIDPACGSGAFPMGMLQKLVHVLKKLDPENKGWKRRQEKAARAIESSTARDEALKAIQRAFVRDNDDYGRKLYLIENCLYGVDIQPIAVQIAKLRFFISLVVAQSIDSQEENYGILPLPNLETKVVAANTLLGLHRGQLLLGSNEVKRLESELQKVRHDYFTARSYKRKKELRKEDKRLCDELAKALEASGECTPYDAKRLAGWNPYDTNTHAPFFDPGWMFGLSVGGPRSVVAEKDGRDGARPSTSGGPFDIVIGNPPYVRQEELKNQTAIGSDGKPQPLKEALKGQYECFTGTADLYVYFIERSLQLLQISGVLSFITSNKYFRAAYGERLRSYLFYATHPAAILDFGDAPVFTSIAYPAILVTKKILNVEKGTLPPAGTFDIPDRVKQLLDSPDRSLGVMTWAPGPDVREFPDIFDRDAFALAQADLKPDGWRMESPARLRLLDRLRKAGTPLGEYVKARHYRGITTGLNEAFIVDRTIRDCLLAEDGRSGDVMHPFLRGRDIKRWRCDSRDLWFLYIPWHFPLHQDGSLSGASSRAERAFLSQYPAVYAHLRQFKRELSARNTAETGVRYEWYALQRCAAEYWHEFTQPKIVFPDIAPSAQFAWDDRNHILGNTSYILVGAKWLLSVLNSSVILWFYRNVSNAIRGGYLRFIGQYIVQIPIPSATSTQQSLCERLAEALIWLHGAGKTDATERVPPREKMEGHAPSWPLMIAFVEQWLNGLVYELFFPGELHARKLKLFDETAKLNPPELAKLRAADKLAALQELHEKAGDRVGNMLQDLKKVDELRVIEETT